MGASRVRALAALLLPLALTACDGGGDGGGGTGGGGTGGGGEVVDPGFVLSHLGENAATLDWDPVAGADRYEIWVLEVAHIEDIVDFPAAPWAVRWEPAGPPFDVARMLDGATEIRCVLRALAGDEVLAESGAPLIVSPARRAEPPVVAVGDGVAWIGWEPLDGGGDVDVNGEPVQWQILRDGALIETLPPHAGGYDPPIGYLDVSGVLTGQTVSYRIGRLTTAGETGPESAPATARIEAWEGVDARADHACARAASGAAYCWGVNEDGQLGAGDAEVHLGAVRVVGEGGAGELEGVEDIAAGAGTSCALLDDGRVLCWGRDLLNPGATSLPPAPLDLGAAVEDVAVGAGFACALSGGQLRCLGVNDEGQLGRGTTGAAPEAAAPVLGPDGAGPLEGVVQWGVGLHHACARLAGGEVYCWGRSQDGQLGLLPDVGEPVPLPTQVRHPYTEEPLLLETLWVGPKGGAGLSADGAQRLWGWGPDWSQQNTSTGEGPSKPRDVTPEDALQQGEVPVAAAPGDHSLVVTNLGRVFQYYRTKSIHWQVGQEDAFAPPFAGTEVLTKGDGYGCLLNRDGLLACRAWCNPAIPYDRDYLGCAGFRAGTRGLNTAQRAHAVRVFMDPAAP